MIENCELIIENYSVKKIKNIFLLIFILIIIFWGYKFFSREKRIFSLKENYSRQIFLNDNGLFYSLTTQQKTVGDFLAENKINISEYDQIIPEKNSSLVSGENIFIRRAVKIKIEVDGKTIENYSLAKNVRAVLIENKIEIGRLDKSEPDFNSPLTSNLKIILTRINVEEKIIPEDIPFKIISKDDPKLSWREKKVSQVGVKGILEVKYKITYKNGKEISRVVLEKNRTKEPIDEINVQGTYMELGKAKRGQASFYAKSWGELNASRDIPRGGYAKITNMLNGKSTVVQINDYGPQSPQRIIDLSYAAFSKIASPGQGIANSVKVEQILN